jgi:hypothetical protein
MFIFVLYYNALLSYGLTRESFTTGKLNEMISLLKENAHQLTDGHYIFTL